ncbi:MAG: 4Fe-4S dicluster domain-containing protein [Chloroflexi bacterium]|nr:MAG: 4Fe-4S dicluster domain-containing protein [Chloroflexota bacterium]
MAKPTYYTRPTFRPTRIPKIRLAHWKPVTAYTRYRWVVQALVVLSFILVPQFKLLKLDLTNNQYWLFGHEVSLRIALQAVVILWLGTYFINFFENYLVGRLLCGWICPWGLLNRLGMIINHLLRRHRRRQVILTGANLLFSTAATLVVMNWMVDLTVLLQPQHPYFGYVWAALGGLVAIGFVILHRMGFKFCETICPFGMYLTVVTQKNSLRVVFDTRRACVDCGLCTQVCPMDLSPREMDFNDHINGGFGQCILCGDCIDVCQERMALENLPPPLRWNAEDEIIPLLPPEATPARQP